MTALTLSLRALNIRFLIVCLILAPALSYAQGSSIIVETDGSNVYVSERGEIIKFDKAGNELVRYSSQMIDEFSILDCTQPLKVLAFSEFSQQYILLDQFLVESGNKRLIDLGVRYATVMCTAKDGGIWVIDQSSMLLKKIDPQRDILSIQVPLETIFRERSSFLSMVEYQNKLYVLEKNKGLHMFDLFGNHLGIVVEGNVTDFQVIKDGIIYTEPRGLYAVRSDRPKVLISEEVDGPFAYVNGTAVYYKDGSITAVTLD